MSNEERFLASYLAPTKHNSLTIEIVNRIFEAYRSDIAQLEVFVEEVDRWKARCELMDVKPERLIDVLNVVNADLYPSIHTIISILLTMPVSSATSERSFSAMRRVKNYLRSTMGDTRMSNLTLMNIHRQIDITKAKVLDDFVNSKNRRLDFY